MIAGHFALDIVLLRINVAGSCVFPSTFESHLHWAVRHFDGFSIRVNRDGEITEAFRVYHGLMERLET
jgi:hypothetical protein